MAVAANLKEQGAAPEDFEATMLRMMAFQRILGDERLAGWVRPSATDADATEVHAAVFEAAGRMPLSMKDRGFNVKRFVRRVRAAANEADPGEGNA